MYRIDKQVFEDFRSLYRYAQSLGYSHAQGPFFIGQWLYSVKGLKLYENVKGKAVPVGWQR